MQLFREFGCSSNSHHIYSENLDLILVFGIYSEFLVAISSRNWLYSEFPVIFIPRIWFSTKPEKPKSRFNSKPKSHFLEIIPIISRYFVLVPPRITLLSTRKSTFRDEKKPSLFPFSQRQSYNILFYIQLSVFGFNDLCVCLCLQASSASVPFSNLFKPYKPSLFLTFPVFFRIEEKGLVAWNRDAQSGCSCKKRSRARRISLKFI